MTMRGYINFGSTTVFNTVTYPISVRFHLLQDFKHWLIALIFGWMLMFTINNLLLCKTNPSTVVHT